jgi:hypothetical protein
VSDRQENLPLDTGPPSKPKRSLPSYAEPTPETHRRLSREEEAEISLKNTLFTRGSCAALIALFCLTIAAVPIIQFGTEIGATHSLWRLPSLGTFSTLGARFSLPDLLRPVKLWHMLPKPEETKAVEKTLRTDSVVAQWLLPRVQSILTTFLGAGNEQVYPGARDWLFYRGDVDYVIGRGFLDPDEMKRRRRSSAVQADAIRAIVDFRDQLARRRIELILVPVPVKPTIEGRKFSPATSRAEFFENSSFAEFKSRLQKQGVRVFDPEPLLLARKKNVAEALYLKADTHWRPKTMQLVAQALAAEIRRSSSAPSAAMQTEEKEISGLGDIARMLKLPSAQTSSYAEQVTIQPILVSNALWRPVTTSEILLLGDSFSNIFSLTALGWGESAGFAEQLSAALHRPIDCILRNSDGAFVTREILAHELARGRDRLAGKKLVVWQFATRELAVGDWKFLPMTLQASRASHFFTPPSGQTVIVTGTVASLSSVPRPGSAPYADHIMALHLVDITGAKIGDETSQCLVYLWSMRENQRTPAARLRPGDKITLRLRAWSDVAPELEKINRSEIDDRQVQLEEPAWGELIK